MLMHWRELNGRHEGETVFVIGAGPQLCDFSREEREAIAARPGIALNGVVHKIPAPYFLSSYMGMCLLAQAEYERLGMEDAIIINLKIGKTSHFWHEGFYRIQKQHFVPELKLVRRWDMRPRICTKKNAALAAAHLAYIMGAARIVFVGVELTSAVHYYHLDTKTNERIYKDVLAVSKRGHRKRRALERMEQQFRPMQVRKIRFENPFLPHAGVQKICDVFVAYQRMMAENGTELVSACPTSALCQVGIPYQPLSEVLG